MLGYELEVIWLKNSFSCYSLCRDVRNGAVLARSSQPEVGWLGWRNAQDENFLQSVAVSCGSNLGNSVPQKPNTGDVCWKETNDASQSNG